MSTNREALSRLMELAAALEPEDLADVIDLAEHLRACESGEDDRDVDALLDRIDADPKAKAKFDQMLHEGLDSAARGDVVDGPTAIAELRANYNLPEARG